jgi:hypothetical protein
MTEQTETFIERVVGRLKIKFDVSLFTAIESAEGLPFIEVRVDDQMIFVLNMPRQPIASQKFELTIKPEESGTVKLTVLLYEFTNGDQTSNGEVFLESIDDAGDKKFGGNLYCVNASNWEDVPGLTPLRRACAQQDLLVASVQS